MAHFPIFAVPALVGLLALCACDLGPDYVKPTVEIPPAFGATLASAAAAWPAPEWWQGFGSAELDGLITDARARNDDLAAAAARVIQADAQTSISGSPLLPTVTGSANGSYNRTGTTRRGGGSFSGITTGAGVGTTTTTSTGAGTTTSTSTNTGSTIVAGGGGGGSHYIDSRQYGGQLAVSYEVDFWGRNRAALQAAEASALASRFDQETVALTVVTSVANTYFQALADTDRLAVAMQNLAEARQLLQLFQARVAAGTATALDVAQQEALVRGEEALIPNFRSLMEQQVIALGILVGRPPESIRVATHTLSKMTAPVVTPGLPSELLARRPDVAFAEANLLAQNANIRVARAAFFPTVQLTSQYGISSLALSTLFNPGSALLQVAGSVTQTIFDNGLKQGDLDLAKGRYAELLANYRRAILQAFTDTDTFLVAYRYATQQEDLERQAVAVAQRANDIARAQLAAGTIDITTVINTQTTLFNDQDTLVQVRLIRFQALVNLFKAVGGGWSLPPGALGTT
jgi:multidrug efflux system outer membrane protein